MTTAEIIDQLRTSYRHRIEGLHARSVHLMSHHRKIRKLERVETACQELEAVDRLLATLAEFVDAMESNENEAVVRLPTNHGGDDR